MTEPRDKQTCEQRIDGQLESRLEDMRHLMNVINASELDELEVADVSEVLNLREEDIKRVEDEDGDFVKFDAAGDEYEGESGLDDLREKAEERRSEWALSVEVKKVVTVMISWGGPSDQFDVELDSDGDITNVTYWFKDWFDGAQRPVQDKTAEQFLGYFTEAIE